MKVLEKNKLADLVVKTILEEIKAGNFKPNDKVPSIDMLSETLNVGISTIREGLQQLQSMGIIEIKQGKGTYINSGISYSQLLKHIDILLVFSKHDVFNLLEARLLIEKETSRLSAKRIGGSELKELHRVIAEMQGSLNEVEAFSKADIEFHLKIAEYSGNPILHIFLKAIQGVLDEEVKAVANLEGARLKAFKDHQAIYNALKRNNAREASMAMGRHLSEVARIITDYVSSYSNPK